MNHLQVNSQNLLDDKCRSLRQAKLKFHQARLQWLKTKLDLTENITNQQQSLGNIDDIKFLKFLTNCRSSSRFILPYRFCENCNLNQNFTIFDWYRKVLTEPNNDNHDQQLVKAILSYQAYFDTGFIEMKVYLKGRHKGYKAKDTMLNKLNSVDASDETTCIMDEENICFYTGQNQISPHTLKNVDWGDHKYNVCTATLTVTLPWLRLTDEAYDELDYYD